MRRKAVYDTNGNQTEQTWYDDNDSVNQKRLYTHAAKGNRTEVAYRKGDGSIVYRNTYTYDELHWHGNWTQKTTFSVNKIGESYVPCLHVTCRTITY